MFTVVSLSYIDEVVFIKSGFNDTSLGHSNEDMLLRLLKHETKLVLNEINDVIVTTS